jgi:hypothetical protein
MMAYRLEGRLLEVCSCDVLCPCWIGEDPDGETCEAIAAYHIDSGTINGLDVSGLTIALLTDIPGNVLKGNWRVVAYVSDHATPEQTQALADVWTGKLGGPVADLAGLVGEVAGLENVPITFTVEGGEGTIIIGDVAEAVMAPYMGATGKATILSETIFSTIPGSPAYVAKASNYHREPTQYGLKPVSLQGHNAIQGNFLFNF